jgi:hypothetical protein
MDTISNHFSIFIAPIIYIPSCAAAFIFDSLGLLCNTTLTASMFSREFTDEGQ